MAGTKNDQNNGNDGKPPVNGGKGDGTPVPTQRTCGTMAVHHRLLATDARYAAARQRIEEQAFAAQRMGTAGRSGCTEIPVVVHVVWRVAAENISQAQIDSQIAVLNADYRKHNADVSSTPAPFAPLAADSRVVFKLATTDPNGNPTNGVTRTQTQVNGFSDDDAVKSAATGGADAWPRDQYLNIWVCKLGGGLLGYAQFPGGPANTDGVVILHSAFGTSGTAAAPFNLGRTATHEVGHWLNLRHIWGDDGDGCGGSDFVADTPNQAGPNFGAPAFPHVSCSNGPNGDMFMNYMDYVDDRAMVMFTTGQVTRMQAALDGPRSAIGHSVSCGKPLPKEVVKEPIKDNPKDFIKEPLKDLPKDGHKDLPKDLHKDNPKDIIKEPVKDGHKDTPKEAHKEPPKDPAKELAKDPPKDGHKDFPKEPIKEFVKDLPKDPPKDVPKDGHKDFPKDNPKDIIKEHPKEGIKDFIKDGGKDPIVDPGPKKIFENPKDLVENPGIPGGGVVNPPIGVAGGGTPFVLGGAVGGTAGGGRDVGQDRQQLLAGYAQLIGALSQIAQTGMLDQGGQMLLQQLMATYQALIAQG